MRPVLPTTPSSEAQLHGLRQRFILFLMAFILPVSGIIFLYQKYTETTTHERFIGEVTANTQQSKLAFEQVVQLATSHISQIGTQLSDAFEKPELRLKENDWLSLEKMGIRRNGPGELTGDKLDPWWRERFGSIFIKDKPQNLALRYKEIAASIAIFPAIRAAHLAHPYFQWTAYYSADADFLMVYPYISPKDLQKSTGTNSTDAMLSNMYEAQTKSILQEIGNKKNPQRKPYWTAPYFDSGGKGAMVTLFTPQYLDQELIGLIGTDLTLHMFDGVLLKGENKLGHLVVVDKRGYILADDDPQKSQDMRIFDIQKSLPNALSKLIQDRSRSAQSLMHHAEGWNWSYSPIAGSEWDLVVYFSDQELQTLTKQDAGYTSWVMLGLLCLLCLAGWTISYYFALPSLRLVDFLIKLSRNPDQAVPRVSKSWQPSFKLVAETSHQRHAYLRELEKQSATLEEMVAIRTREVVAQSELAEKARKDIALISELGRQITASLDQNSIENTIYSHVRQLLSFNRFSIALYDTRHHELQFNFVLENGERRKTYQETLDNCDKLIQQCILGKREIHTSEPVDHTSENGVSLSEHFPSITSQLLVPLIIQERVLGLISLQHPGANYYHENDLIILRSLAAYSSVAFDNASSYERLKQTQEKLLEQEKLAALGSIVAGVAHELNTPIGNSLLAASTLADLTAQTNREINNNTLRRSSFLEYTANALHACHMLMRNLTTAAQLITSFKQIAVDQSSDQKRHFNLHKVSTEIVATLEARMRRAGCSLSIAIAEEIELDSYPGPYCQLISNLVQNALVHAFENRSEAWIRIQAETRADGNEITIRVEDNGIGIDNQHLPHIFEPFYTTKLGRGGSGLGLHICYNIATAVLGGSIKVISVKNQGTIVEIRLPTHAP